MRATLSMTLCLLKHTERDIRKGDDRELTHRMKDIYLKELREDARELANMGVHVFFFSDKRNPVTDRFDSYTIDGAIKEILYGDMDKVNEKSLQLLDDYAYDSQIEDGDYIGETL